jgi:hypothetical protein
VNTPAFLSCHGSTPQPRARGIFRSPGELSPAKTVD